MTLGPQIGYSGGISAPLQPKSANPEEVVSNNINDSNKKLAVQNNRNSQQHHK